MLGVGVRRDDGTDGASELAAGRRNREALGEADRDALAVLLSVDGLGPLTLGRLVDRLGSPAAILEAASGTGGAGAILERSRAADGEWRTMPRNVAHAIADAAGNRTKLL